MAFQIRVCITCAVIVLTSHSAITQSQTTEPSAIFKVGANLVTIQVSLTDKHGSPVTKAKVEDFQIFEDGEKKPEQIAYFQPVMASTGQKDVESSTAQNKKPESPQIRIPAILLMDALNTEPADQMYARYSISRALDSLPPDTPVAVMRLDTTLWLLQDFTRDRQSLQDALRRAISSASMTNLGAGSLDKVPTPPTPAPGQAKAGNNNSLVDLASLLGGLHASSEKDFQSGMMDIRVEQTLAALEAVAKLVGHYRIRKNLMWVSGSFPLSITADAEAQDNRVKFAGIRDYTEQTEKAANILADANIAIYPIDARGLQPPAMYSAAQAGAQHKGDSEFVDRVDRQATMSLLADETGGRTCTDTNDLGGCMTNAIAHGSSYYEIGYYPRNRNWNGKFRHIKIKYSFHNVELRYRSGYFAESQTTEKAAARSEAHSASSPPHLQIFQNKFGQTGTLNWSQDRIEYTGDLPIAQGARGFFDWVWGRRDGAPYYQCDQGKLTPVSDAARKEKGPIHQIPFQNLRGDLVVVELLGKNGVEYKGTGNLSVDASAAQFFQLVRLFFLCKDRDDSPTSRPAAGEQNGEAPH